MQLACIAVALGAMILAGYLASLLRDAHRDIQELATEAILATRSSSAEELAHASTHAHAMRMERQAPPTLAPQSPFVSADQPNDPDKVQLANGTILNVLRPLG